MPHFVIIGQTTSGKTFLAQNLAKGFKKKGIKTLVMRKPREGWHEKSCDYQTSDFDLFYAEYEKQRRINWKDLTSSVAFIEVSDGGTPKYDERLRKLATEGRHDGFRFFFLAQRGAMIHPDIRENCVGGWFFTCGMEAAKMWAAELNDPNILRAADIPKRQFVYKPMRGEPSEWGILKV